MGQRRKATPWGGLLRSLLPHERSWKSLLFTPAPWPPLWPAQGSSTLPGQGEGEGSQPHLRRQTEVGDPCQRAFPLSTSPTSDITATSNTLAVPNASHPRLFRAFSQVSSASASLLSFFCHTLTVVAPHGRVHCTRTTGTVILSLLKHLPCSQGLPGERTGTVPPGPQCTAGMQSGFRTGVLIISMHWCNTGTLSTLEVLATCRHILEEPEGRTG